MTPRSMTGTALAASVLLLGAVGTAAADQGASTSSSQGSSSSPSMQSSPSSSSSSSSPSSQSSGRSSSGSTATMSGSLTPTQFVTQAAEGGLAEVQLAQLAQKQGQSPEVKQFAARMIADHGKANTELQSIARSKNLTLPKEPNAEQKATMKQLQGKKGAEFDAAYMAEMDKDHKKTIALFQSAASLEDPQLQAFATKTLPVLQEHHQMVENTRPVNQATR